MRSWPNARYNPNICMEGLREITTQLEQNNILTARDLNLESLESEASIAPFGMTLS
jgi:hypothetical protein